MSSGKWWPFCVGLNVLKNFHRYCAVFGVNDQMWYVFVVYIINMLEKTNMSVSSMYIVMQTTRLYTSTSAREAGISGMDK